MSMASAPSFAQPTAALSPDERTPAPCTVRMAGRLRGWAPFGRAKYAETGLPTLSAWRSNASISAAGDFAGVRRGFIGTEASSFFLPSQKSAKSEGTGRLGRISVGAIPAPALAVTFSPLPSNVTLHCRKPGSFSEPVIVAWPPERAARPVRRGSTPSLLSVHATSPLSSGLPWCSTRTVNVTV